METRTSPLSAAYLDDLYQRGQHHDAWTAIMTHQKMNPLEASAPWLHWYQPFWWRPLTSKRCRLRRRGPHDLQFIRSLWADSDFMYRFHRRAPALPDADERLASILTTELNHSVVSQRALHWIVEADSKPAGLLSLTELSTRDRRAEILIGVQPGTPSQIATAAMLMAFRFVFEIAHLNKLVSLVHADNAHSIKSTRHLGFSQEGLLKRQVFDASARDYVDLLQFALFAEEATGPSNQRLMRRLGVDHMIQEASMSQTPR